VALPDLRELPRTSFIEASAYHWVVEHEHVAQRAARHISDQPDRAPPRPRFDLPSVPGVTTR
jgi:hypothetical protein